MVTVALKIFSQELAQVFVLAAGMSDIAFSRHQQTAERSEHPGYRCAGVGYIQRVRSTSGKQLVTSRRAGERKAGTFDWPAQKLSSFVINLSDNVPKLRGLVFNNLFITVKPLNLLYFR